MQQKKKAQQLCPDIFPSFFARIIALCSLRGNSGGRDGGGGGGGGGGCGRGRGGGKKRVNYVCTTIPLSPSVCGKWTVKHFQYGFPPPLVEEI